MFLYNMQFINLLAFAFTKGSRIKAMIMFKNIKCPKRCIIAKKQNKTTKIVLCFLK